MPSLSVSVVSVGSSGNASAVSLTPSPSASAKVIPEAKASKVLVDVMVALVASSASKLSSVVPGLRFHISDPLVGL